ncbi:uncharacterized protein LOC105192075 isoform X1 [Harpegnathos saltator]|uniref:uncharacterized protein LOC105192075 isoform X1 n=2 Tax=Harpegnathos saltator TaxID=610380 RepID=UPI000DBEECEB|nr:uncharacterized protein LOC105192075 isoform X1 [Harpegnathos saltator]
MSYGSPLEVLVLCGISRSFKYYGKKWKVKRSKVMEIVTTGNIGGPPITLTDREKKILGLIGLDYVEGVQCSDSFPEEQGEAMHLLTAGDERILNDIPESLTLRNNEIIEHDVNYIDYEVLHDMENVIEEGSSFNNIQTHSQIQNAETAECHREITEPPSAIQTDDPQRLTTVTQSSSKKRKRPQITRNSERLGTQLHNAREDFAILAERQISCMEMFAKAMQQIADNEKERNECLRAFIEAERSRETTYSELLIIIKDCVEVLKKKIFHITSPYFDQYFILFF